MAASFGRRNNHAFRPPPLLPLVLCPDAGGHLAVLIADMKLIQREINKPVKSDQKMTFVESIKTCFSKYADFNGRASRSEFWWWVLFVFLVSAATSVIGNVVSGLFSLGVLLPNIAVAARRLHDTDRSGWLQLVALIPLIGWILMIYWCVQEGKDPNRFGPSSSTQADMGK